MKAAPLLIHWHNETPIYSADFEVNGKGRLATAGGDNNVRLWKVETQDEERKITYLSTLVKHTCAVNVVRWCPKGEMLASAGDDGNVLLWVPAAEGQKVRAFGDDGLEDKETWRVKRICGAMGTDVYDLAWSPDGSSFITGSMDNVARIWNASTGACIRQIAEHNNFIQGVAWDPLNEYIATQSSDKSVHIWALKDKQGEFSLHNKFSRMEHNANNPRRISSSSPAPPDFSGRHASIAESTSHPIGSPIPSVPGTPQSLALPMNPPPTSHSRRSSFGTSPSMRRSASPAPSLPLPAVMPTHSPSLSAIGLGMRSLAYADPDKFTSFFRRLAFAPDGSLLFTPSGQIKVKPGEFVNTVYIHARGGFNKDPIAHLPGHKKASIAVKCSPIYYTHRSAPALTKHVTIDTSTADEDIPALPEPAVMTRQPSTSHSMDPPPINAPSPAPSFTAPSPKSQELDSGSTPAVPAGPTPVINLPYRIVYAVATQDAVHIHDTQQIKPLIVVSNLHYATFTDLSWAPDGNTLLVTSSDGFCSYLSFTPGELGTRYHGPVPTMQNPHPVGMTGPSHNLTPSQTPLSSQAPLMSRQPSFPGPMPPSPSKFATPITFPGSPARSMSASSVASFPPLPTEQNARETPSGEILMNATPSLGSVPGIAAANSGPVPGNVPLWTPPETPSSNPFPGPGNAPTPSSHHGNRTHSASSSMSGITGPSVRRGSEAALLTVDYPEGADVAKKREPDAVAEGVQQPSKKRRIAPVQIIENNTPEASTSGPSTAVQPSASSTGSTK